MKKGSKHTKETKAKISKSLEGNSNPEVYTFEVVVDLLNKMIDYAEQPQIIKDLVSVVDTPQGTKETYSVKNKAPHNQTELLRKFKIRYHKWFSYISTKFEKNETVLNLLGCLNHILKDNLYNAGINGDANASIVKMNLATHHGWSDSTKQDVKIEKESLTDSELDILIKRFEQRNK